MALICLTIFKKSAIVSLTSFIKSANLFIFLATSLTNWTSFKNSPEGSANPIALRALDNKSFKKATTSLNCLLIALTTRFVS